MLYKWSVESTDPSLPSEQFTRVINSQVLACDCFVDQSIPESEFETVVEKASLGSIEVFRYHSWGMHTARRTDRHVSEEQTDDILLYLPLTSQFVVNQDSVALDLSPGNAALVRMDRPFASTFVGKARYPLSGANIRLPMSMMRERLPLLDNCMLKVLSTRTGAGRILLDVLQSVFREARHLEGASTKLIGSALLDAVCATGADSLELTQSSLPAAQTSRNLTRLRVEQFILASLSNPLLSPQLIADKCRLSIRYLHTIFEDTEWTVSAWIREQRLEHCRMDLRNPALERKTVAEIAYCWGFKDSSHFSRAYKDRFGTSPSMDRQPESLN